MGIGNNFSLNKTSKTMEQNVNDVSRISQGASIRGTLTSATDIRVDGQVDGTLLSAGKVVTGESARLSGKLLCVNADFRGRMEGDIYVKELLSRPSQSIAPIANLCGWDSDIYLKRLFKSRTGMTMREWRAKKTPARS